MKKVLLIICLAILCILLTGCDKREDAKYQKNNVDVFETQIKQRILIDKETGVQYIILGNGHDNCMSVRLDANGKPMVDRSVK